MNEKSVLIVNRAGLHARSSAKLVDLATGFSCDIEVGLGEKFVDGKSILALMMLAATQGSELTVRADGDDAVEALDSICALISEGFGEEC